MAESSTAGGAGAVTARDQGMSLMRLGKFADAAQVLMRAVEADANDAMAWQLLGGARASSGNPNGAVEAFRRALALTPTSAKSNYNLALALQATGQSYDAKSHLERAVALDPNYEQAKAKLAEISNAATNSSYGAGAVGQKPEGSSVNGESRGGSDGLRAFAVSAAPPPSTGAKDNTTNIGVGDSGGLAPIGATFLSASAAASEGSTNIGVGAMGGLAGIGGNQKSGAGIPSTPVSLAAPAQPAAPALAGLGGLGSVGGGASAPPPATMAPQLSAPMAPHLNAPQVNTQQSFTHGGFTVNNANGAPVPVLGARFTSVSDTDMSKIRAFNIGAFLWGLFPGSWIWAAWHGGKGLGWAMFFVDFALRVLLVPVAFTLGALPAIILYYLGNLGQGIWMGIIGGDTSWGHRQYQDLDSFKASHRVWVILGVVLVLLQFLGEYKNFTRESDSERQATRIQRMLERELQQQSPPSGVPVPPTP